MCCAEPFGIDYRNELLHSLVAESERTESQSQYKQEKKQNVVWVSLRTRFMKAIQECVLKGFVCVYDIRFTLWRNGLVVVRISYRRMLSRIGAVTEKRADLHALRYEN